jgi:hypothetical protein
MSNSRYPEIHILGGRDAFDTEVADIWGYHAETGKPAAIATDAEIRAAIESSKSIMQWVSDDQPKYEARVAVLEAELTLRERINTNVVLPDVEAEYENLWHKDRRTWNPAKSPVFAVRTHDQHQGGRYIDLGMGSISGALGSAAHAIRVAEYLRQVRGWQVEPVACPCLFSDYESHISLDEREGGR